MIIRQALESDYEEVVEMFYNLIKDVYPQRKLTSKINFHKSVMNWVNNGADIILAIAQSDKIAGFTLCYIKDEGIYEPYYFGDIAYVKPEYRMSKAAFLLYKHGSEVAERLNMPLVAKAYIGNGNRNLVDKIQEKFNMKPQFVEYERGA